METIEIQYDDQVDDAAYSAIYAANKLLKTYGLVLNIDRDDKEHDGFEILEIKLLEL